MKIQTVKNALFMMNFKMKNHSDYSMVSCIFIIIILLILIVTI